MSMNNMLPEKYKVVQALQPQALGGARTGDIVCLKNVVMAWIVVQVTRGADATDLNLYVYKDTGDGVAGIAATVAVPIWSNIDTAATDTLVRQTDAVSIATGVVQNKNHTYVFQVDPATLGPTYDWMYLLTSAGHAAHFISATYFLEMKYQQATPPTAVA